MPIYEHKCQACGRTFDVKAGIKDAATKASCPVCGSPKTGRLFSVFSRTAAGSACAPAPRKFG